MSLFTSNYPRPVTVGTDMNNRLVYCCPYTQFRVDCMPYISVNKHAIEWHIRHMHLAVFLIPAKLYECPSPNCRALCPNVSGYRSHCAYWHPARCPIEGCSVLHILPNHPHVMERARLRALMTGLKAAYEEDYFTAMLRVPDPEMFFAPQRLDYGVDVSQILQANV